MEGLGRRWLQVTLQVRAWHVLHGGTNLGPNKNLAFRLFLNMIPF